MTSSVPGGGNENVVALTLEGVCVGDLGKLVDPYDLERLPIEDREHGPKSGLGDAYVVHVTIVDDRCRRRLQVAPRSRRRAIRPVGYGGRAATRTTAGDGGDVADRHRGDPKPCGSATGVGRWTRRRD